MQHLTSSKIVIHLLIFLPLITCYAITKQFSVSVSTHLWSCSITVQNNAHSKHHFYFCQCVVHSSVTHHFLHTLYYTNYLFSNILKPGMYTLQYILKCLEVWYTQKHSDCHCHLCVAHCIVTHHCLLILCYTNFIFLYTVNQDIYLYIQCFLTLMHSETWKHFPIQRPTMHLAHTVTHAAAVAFFLLTSTSSPTGVAVRGVTGWQVFW